MSALDRENALYCRDVADWIERTRDEARRTGNFDTRCLVQNVSLIISALRDIAARAAADEQSENDSEAQPSSEEGMTARIREVTHRDAAMLAPVLDKMIDEFMEGISGVGAERTSKDEIMQFLWDNKIGILRIMQAHADIAEIERLRRDLDYAYRCVSSGYNQGVFDFSILKDRALAYVRAANEQKADERGQLEKALQSWYCEPCAVEVYDLRCSHCGKTQREQR